MPRLCDKYNKFPAEVDITLLSAEAATCEMLLRSTELEECFEALQSVTCSYYCQPCVPNVSQKGLLRLCPRFCQNVREGPCARLVEEGCTMTLDQFALCAPSGEPCGDMLDYDINGAVVVSADEGNIVPVVVGVSVGACCLLFVAIAAVVLYRRSQCDEWDQGAAKNNNTEE